MLAEREYSCILTKAKYKSAYWHYICMVTTILVCSNLTSSSTCKTACNHTNWDHKIILDSYPILFCTCAFQLNFSTMHALCVRSSTTPRQVLLSHFFVQAYAPCCRELADFLYTQFYQLAQHTVNFKLQNVCKKLCWHKVRCTCFCLTVMWCGNFYQRMLLNLLNICLSELQTVDD